MRIQLRAWSIFIFFSLLSLLVWYQFSYPQFSSVNISIPRSQALKIAKQYLKEQRGVDTSPYTTAIVFVEDDKADRYLQKNLHFKGEQEFLHKNDFQIFFWLVRFFQENKKEEFRLIVSSATGEVM